MILDALNVQTLDDMALALATALRDPQQREAALRAFERAEAALIAADDDIAVTELGASRAHLDLAARRDSALVIGPDARWFRAPGGARIDLTRRRQLRLILAALTAARRAQPGTTLTVDQLLACGWPGETVLAVAGASRVYVAISTLRRMGLRDVLIRIDAGYLIDPTAELIAHGDSTS